MKKTLLVVDSYISDLERSKVCENLIGQIREVFDDGYEILLINKSGNNFELENKVDYYYNQNNSFLVGLPPKSILDNEQYERPYIYISSNDFTCENWLPLIGVTDHVAGIFNSILISCNFGKFLGYESIFKFEYDTVFDLNELRDIKKDIEKEKDYIFYGVRKMGEYAKNHQYLIDVHTLFYSVNLFYGFNILKNDEDFWNLCKKINYFGKWIEYIIPSVLEYQKRINTYDGIEYEGLVEDKYPLTQFDIINGKGGWTDRWKNIPKICSIKEGVKQLINEDILDFVLFYYNEEDEQLDINVTMKNSKEEIIHEKSIILNKNNFYHERFTLNDEFYIIEKINKRGNIEEKFTNRIDRDYIINTNTHFRID